MRKTQYFGLFLMIGGFFVFSRPAQAATTLTTCQRILTAGSYILANNVTQTAPGACFSIRASNVTFDGNGKTITAVDADAVEVAYYGSGEVAHDVTVSNFVSNGSVRTYGDTIDRVTFDHLTVSGIWIGASDDVTMTNNTIGAGGVAISNSDLDGWSPYRARLDHNTIIGGSTDVKILVEVVGGRSHPCPRLDTVITNNTITSTRADVPQEANAAVRFRCATHTTFTGNTVRSTGTSLGLYLRDEADDNVIANNTFVTNDHPALWIAAGNVDKTWPARNDIRNNVFLTSAGYTMYALGLGADNHFTNNLFQTGQGFLGYTGGEFGNVWDHNTFYIASPATGAMYLGGNRYPGPPANTYTNNIFSYSGTALFSYDGWMPSRYVGDYNVFHNRSGAVSFGTLGSLSDWRAAVGGDTHSVEVDPLFANPATGDFSLQATSPVKAAASDRTAAGYSPALAAIAPIISSTNPAPTITITTPTGKGVLSGATLVQVTAKDTNGVARVNFLVDGVQFGTDIRVPFRANLDTRKLRNGSHVLTIQAIDTKGATSTRSRTLTVKNPLTVRISVPTVKGVLRGSVVLTPKLISGGAAVTTVEYFIDRRLVGQSASAPYAYTWDSQRVKNGVHRFTIRVTDATGKQAVHTINARVRN